MIRVASSQINVNAHAMEIYVSGCTRKCEGCHNAEIQDFSYGIPWKEWWPKQDKKLKSSLIQRIWLLGGDALCQTPFDFSIMASDLKRTGKELWLWTGADFRKIPYVFNIEEYFDYLKAGRYDCHNKNSVVYHIGGRSPYDLKLIGDNQHLYRLEYGNWVECEK